MKRVGRSVTTQWTWLGGALLRGLTPPLEKMGGPLDSSVLIKFPASGPNLVLNGHKHLIAKADDCDHRPS